MAEVDALSDADIDFILRQFDQAAPALQRRVVAEFVLRIARYRAALERIAARWPECQDHDRAGYQDHYDGYGMCQEAREALGLDT